MRINQVMNNLGATMTGKVGDNSEGSFDQTLAGHRSTNIKEKLKGLLERIDIQGKRLSDKMDLSELKEYKRLISEFLNIAVNSSHRFSKEHYLDSRGRHRVYAIVKKVDEELESLTNSLLKNEKNTIGVLGKIDNIRGMLIDIMA